MRSNRLSAGMNVAVALLCAAVFVTPTYAAGPQEKVLHNFNNNGRDGIGPVSALIFDKAGNLYGTTQYGGTGICTFSSTPGCGTVFELSPKKGGGWVEKILHNFVDDGLDGTAPQAALILDAAGNLYGTTAYGGSGNSFSCAYQPGCGTVFELSPIAGGGWTERVIHNFNEDGIDGLIPETSLIFDAAGNLYGVTDSGGSAYYGSGTVFELSPQAGGAWTETILHYFPDSATDGYYPQGVIFDASGNLYGTTYTGDAYAGGTVFELTPAAGGGWTETILNSFGKTGFDGYNPYASLIFDTAGNLYGTTVHGGGGQSNSGGGTIFKLTPATGGGWTEKILHSFEHSATSGDFPRGALIFDASGNLYSTTVTGGHSTLCLGGGCGTVFKLTPGADGHWTETLLNSFGRGKDGQYPTAGVIFDAAGNLYGTTSAGGLYGAGTVFEIIP
jgi:uncharacterized repeat protein (TIGR03803 family)